MASSKQQKWCPGATLSAITDHDDTLAWLMEKETPKRIYGKDLLRIDLFTSNYNNVTPCMGIQIMFGWKLMALGS